MGLVLSLCLAGAARAQETGGIGGRITDATGAVLPDCIVEVAGETGIARRRQVSGAAGGYGFAGLPAGRYRLSFERAGFQPASVEGVLVESGLYVELDVALEIQELSGAVEVRAQTGALDRKRSGRAAILEGSWLSLVPTGRSLWSALEHTPGLVADRIDVGGSEAGQQSLFSAAGTSYAQNQYYLNGINVTDPAALGASATYYAYEAFAEVQIATHGHRAEIQAPGVVVNIVVKSGGNELGGGAAFSFENDSLQSDNLDDRLRARGVPQSNPLDAYHDLGLELGGPIVRGDASFYASYAWKEIRPFVIGFFLPGGEPGVDSTELSTFLGRGRLEIGAGQSLGLLFFRNRKLRPHREAGRSRPTPAATLHQDSESDVLQTLYSRAFGDRTFLDARFSWMNLDFPLGEQPDLAPDAASRIELGSGVRSGGPGSDQLFQRDRRQANAALFVFRDEWLSGSHEMRFGGELSFHPTRTTYDLMGAVLYRDLFGSPLQVELYSEPLTVRNHTRNLALFAGDSYVRGRLALDLGARFDRWTAGFPDQNRSPGRWEELFRSRGLPESTPGNGSVLSFSSLAPRLGFTYGLTADGRTLLRGNYSRYYHQIGADLAAFANPNGRGAALFSFRDANGNRILDAGEIDLDAPLAVSLPVMSEIDPRLEQPRTDEVSLGLSRELFSRMSLSATLVYRKDRLLFDDVEVGVPAVEFQEELAVDPGRDLAVGTEDDGLVPVFNQSRESLGRDRLRLTNPAGLESRYRGLVLEGAKRSSQGWLVLLSLTLSESEGFLPGPGFEGEEGAGASSPLFDDPNSLTHAKGRTFWDRPRILRASGSYDWNGGWTFSGSYRYQTGRPLYRSILVRETASGIPLNQGPIEILAEPQGSIVQPSVHLLDLSVRKGFSLGRWGDLELILDLFNALNANTATELSPRAGSFGAILEILPPRVARIGVRYRFGAPPR